MTLTTVYRVTVPSAYRRVVTNLQTGKVSRFTTDGSDDGYAIVARGASAMGDDLSTATLTYGGNLQNRLGHHTGTSFYVATYA
jgi:bifunctional DNA-binding transcriptional regulator/antitoxin component of YhaV-PrlF toxin-antitoxin module